MDNGRVDWLPHNHAGVASAFEGQVLLDGPNAVALTFTPDAATQTAESLLAAAAKARTMVVAPFDDGAGG